MKRIISIILIAGISFSSLHLDELTKLRTLVFHYLEHKQSHPETTVITFLYDHYVTNKKADSARDKERNSQLPFKSPQNFHSHISVAVFSEISVLLKPVSVAFVPVPLNLLNYSKSPLAIWQPPKLS